MRRHTYDYAYGDSFNMNDPNVKLQFKECLWAVQLQKCLQATPQAKSQSSSQ